jgi:hypothetical protein
MELQSVAGIRLGRPRRHPGTGTPRLNWLVSQPEPGIDLDNTVGRSSKLESLIVKCNSVVRVLPAVLKQCLNLGLKLVLVHHARV